MMLATIATGAVVYLVVRAPEHVAATPRDLSTSSDAAQLVGKGLLKIAPGSALEKKLEVRTVKAETVDAPLLTATASVLAHSLSGSANPVDRWEFATAELSNAYADWRRAQNDVEFTDGQLARTRELADAQVTRYTEALERLKKLVETGTETQKDLVAAQADLLQAQIQTQKDVFDAQSAHNSSQRARAAAERALAQAGLDPAVFEKPDGVAVVVAQIPEARIGLVQQGQACSARFYAFPDEAFTGQVARVGSTLSTERRTLRVVFLLTDGGDRLKPGLFADVGLGTEPRQSRVVPAEAVIHAGRGDFVFARAPGASAWRIAQVQLGDTRGGLIEVLGGVGDGEEVVGAGAILLKPFVIRSQGPES